MLSHPEANLNLGGVDGPMMEGMLSACISVHMHGSRRHRQKPRGQSPRDRANRGLEDEVKKSNEHGETCFRGASRPSGMGLPN